MTDSPAPYSFPLSEDFLPFLEQMLQLLQSFEISISQTVFLLSACILSFLEGLEGEAKEMLELTLTEIGHDYLKRRLDEIKQNDRS